MTNLKSQMTYDEYFSFVISRLIGGPEPKFDKAGAHR
jgi:hypothetical protein